MIVVTGPEGSGTRFLATVLRERFGVEPVHRPMPEHDVWWDYRDDPPGTRYVVIIRRPDVTQLAILGQLALWEGTPVRALRHDWHEAREWWHRAVETLAGIPDAWWVSYEALVADVGAQADNLGRWLGLDPTGPVPEARDENAKWLTYIER